MKPSSRLRFSTQGGNRPCSLSYRVAGEAAARGRAAAHSSTPSHPEETAADAIASTNLGASGEVARGRCQGECRDADGGRSERGQGEAFAAQRVRRRGLGLLLLGGHVVGREKKSKVREGGQQKKEKQRSSLFLFFVVVKREHRSKREQRRLRALSSPVLLLLL